MRQLLACFLLLFLLGLSACTKRTAVPRRELAFVAAERSNAVTVIDLDRMSAIASIPVSRAPIAVRAGPVRNEVYVATRAGRLEVIDAVGLRLAGSVAVAGSPMRLEVNERGNMAFVLSRVEPAVHIVDMRARRVLNTIPLEPGSEPVAWKLAPNRKLLCVGDAAARQLQILDLDRGAVVARVSLPAAPAWLEILPDSSQVFAAQPAASRVSAVDLQQMKLLVHLPVGRRPVHLALKPDGGEMIASNAGSNSITILSPYTDEVALTMPVGAEPVETLISRDGARGYVANSASDSVSVVDIENRKVLAAVSAGAGPFRLALTGDEHFLLVLNSRSNDMAIIRSRAEPISLLTILPVGVGPSDLAVVETEDRRQKAVGSRQ